ncbi:MAG: prolipoprotein diacylglyceryl transferase [Vicinamibacterales bacterium]
MITINWDPVVHLGPIPINWYGLGWAMAFMAALWLVRRWTPRSGLAAEHVENLAIWSLAGAFAGARLYFIAQNDPMSYLLQPWRMLAVWEGGLAFFGGLFGAILAAFVYARRHAVPFARAADLFAPAIPIAGAIGRIPCFLAGMDYGTPTALPWSVEYTNPAGYAPIDGVSRHPVQVYELLGDLAIAGVLLRLRGRLPNGVLFVSYLISFSLLRFSLFFVRGDVPAVALGLTNGHWTALALLAVAVVMLAGMMIVNRRGRRHGHANASVAEGRVP